MAEQPVRNHLAVTIDPEPRVYVLGDAETLAATPTGWSTAM